MTGFFSGVVAVVDKARSDRPYVAAKPLRIYRMVSATEMEGLPYWEARLVEDLLSEGELVPGRQVELSCGEFTRTVNILEPNTRNPDISDQRPLKGWV